MPHTPPPDAATALLLPQAAATFRELDLRWDILRVEFRVPGLAKSRLRTVYSSGKKAQKRLRVRNASPTDANPVCS